MPSTLTQSTHRAKRRERRDLSSVLNGTADHAPSAVRTKHVGTPRAVKGCCMAGASKRRAARLIGLLIAGWMTLAHGAAAASEAQLEAWAVTAVPALSLPALDGATVDLPSQRGGLVIVHFFATWCEPCRDELVSLERLAAGYAARPLRIVAVDVGEPGDRVRRFLARNGITLRYPVLIDFDKQAMRAWRVDMLPTSYVLDARLCPLWKVEGALEWDIGATRATLEARVVEIEHTAARSNEENCIVEGGTQ
jgi:thiol-disulfide isomerase/thioredoxin